MIEDLVKSKEYADTRVDVVTLKTKNGEIKQTTVAEICELALKTHLENPKDYGLFSAMKNYEKSFWYLVDNYSDGIDKIISTVQCARENSEPRLVRFICDDTLKVSFPRRIKK